MDKIPSFTIDHTKLLRGIYVSRKDYVGQNTITSFDIRMKEPNRGHVLEQRVLHTIEHLAATYLRNNPEWMSRIIYWGPMGCRTGNYLIIAGNYESSDIVELMKEMFTFIRDFEGEIPGSSPKDCGNWRCNDLAKAKIESGKYLSEVLDVITNKNLIYPK